MLDRKPLISTTYKPRGTDREYTVSLRVSKHPDGDKPGYKLVKLGMELSAEAKRMTKPKGTSSHVIFVLDISRSMGIEQADRTTILDSVKKTLTEWVNRPEIQDCKFSVITFANSGHTLLVNGDAQTAVAQLRQIKIEAGTYIKAGFDEITKKMAPNSSNTVVFFLTDGNESIYQKKSNPIDVIKSLKGKLGELPKIVPLGLGTSSDDKGTYDAKVLAAFGSATNSPHRHFSSTRDLRKFFQSEATALTALRTPVSVKLNIGNGKCRYEKKLEAGGIAAGNSWEEVFEIYTGDSDDQKPLCHLTYDVNNTVAIDQKAVADFSIQDDEVISLFIARKATSIFNALNIEKSNKVLMLHDLLEICPSTCVGAFKLIEKSIESLQPKQQSNKKVNTTSSQMALLSSSSSQMMRSNFMDKHLAAQPHFNRDKNTLTYDEEEYQAISRKTDFTDAKLQRAVSVDGGLGRENITLMTFLIPREDKEFKSLPSEWLRAVADEVKSTFQSDDISKVVKESKQDHYPLMDFMRHKVGQCRHHALLACCLIGRKVRQNNLGGSVHLFRGTAWNLKGHAWAIYKNGQDIYLIDSYSLSPKKVYKLNDSTEAKAVINKYKEVGLEGVLEELFRYYKIPHHPPMTRISEEALEHVKDDELFEQRKLICPITTEIIREPVVLRTKNGEFVFEKGALEEWFKGHTSNPYTGLELEEKERTIYPAPHKLVEIWRTIQGVTEMLPEAAAPARTGLSPPQRTPKKPINFTVRVAERTARLDYLTQQAWLAEFKSKYKADLDKTCWGRSNIKYDSASVKEIIAHANNYILFKRRTTRILEELGVDLVTGLQKQPAGNR